MITTTTDDNKDGERELLLLKHCQRRRQPQQRKQWGAARRERYALADARALLGRFEISDQKIKQNLFRLLHHRCYHIIEALVNGLVVVLRLDVHRRMHVPVAVLN